MAEEGIAGGWKWLESVPEPVAFSPEPCRNRHGTVPEPATFLPEPPFRLPQNLCVFCIWTTHGIRPSDPFIILKGETIMFLEGWAGGPLLLAVRLPLASPF